MMIEVTSNFANGAEGWAAGFTDFSLATAGEGLLAGIRTMPANLGLDSTGYYIQGTNRSDDLFMFLARRLTPQNQIEPLSNYLLEYEIHFASKAPSGAIGVGGPPGEAVFVKAGASTLQPVALIDDSDTVSISIDKGNQGEGGADVGVAGNVANGRSVDEPEEYVSLTITYQHPTPIQSDASGNIWLIVGTDSGFEAATALYYQRINVKLKKQC